MGTFYSVCGWFEGDKEHFAQAMALVSQNADDNPYSGSWHFPTVGGGFTRFIFFGHTVRDTSLPKVRSQVRRLATEVQSADGDDLDHLTGIFHVTAEDDSVIAVWKCANGHFSDSSSAP